MKNFLAVTQEEWKSESAEEAAQTARYCYQAQRSLVYVYCVWPVTTLTWIWPLNLCAVLISLPPPPPPPPLASEAAAGVGIDPQASVKLCNFRTQKAVFLDHFVLEQPANQVRTFLLLLYSKQKRKKERHLKLKTCLFQIATQHMRAPEVNLPETERPNSDILHRQAVGLGAPKTIVERPSSFIGHTWTLNRADHRSCFWNGRAWHDWTCSPHGPFTCTARSRSWRNSLN